MTHFLVSMTIRDIRRTVQKYALQTIIVCFVMYFLYHLIQGGRGIMTLRALETRLATASTELSQLKQAHDRLENRVHLMRPESLCPDLLEEQAKIILGYKHPEEKIVLEMAPASP